MAQVKIRLADRSVYLDCRGLRGREALGETMILEIDAVAPEPLPAERVFGKACEVTLSTGFAERLKMDVHYVRNWSPWLDIYLLARTFEVVIKGTGV